MWMLLCIYPVIKCHILETRDEGVHISQISRKSFIVYTHDHCIFWCDYGIEWLWTMKPPLHNRALLRHGYYIIIPWIFGRGAVMSSTKYTLSMASNIYFNTIYQTNAVKLIINYWHMSINKTQNKVRKYKLTKSQFLS